MAKTIYVGNLPYSASNTELEEIFATIGAVSSAKVVMDRESGRSKGFGFVEMNDDNEASTAIEQLNGKDLNGRQLRVNEARPRESRSSGGYRQPQF
jgi:cold-inducible RNA-binding protein